MEARSSDGCPYRATFVLLFGLCIPAWVIGAMFDIQLFPGFKLFPASLAMPMVAFGPGN
jgi:hypothetical protein